MAATAAAPRAGGWLYGPVPDLLFGCGILYALLFVAFALLGPSLRALQPSFFIPVLILLVSMPHYGGTLVRVYDQRRDRRSYAIFSVWATLLIGALFVWGTLSSLVASWLFTVYITWSPWHYTGQNYGLAVMFLRRRGVPLSAGVKRLFYASFGLAYLLTFLVFHSAISLIDYNASEAANSAIVFLPLGIPPAVHRILFPLAALGYLATLVAVAALLLRRAQAGDLLPAAALVLTQALWFSIPFAVRYFGVSTGIEPVDLLRNRIEDYFKWVALAHAAQYLWVTSYYARGSPSWQGFPRYFGKVLASGVAIWTLPVLFFAPLVQGRFEYAGGLALLVASAVNLHHFVLDGAIWKLRNSKIASVLIRAEPESPAGAPEASAPRASWLRPAVWGAATLGLTVGVTVLWLEDFALRSAFIRQDAVGLNRVLDRMAWLGRDNTAARMVAAGEAARTGDWEASLAAHRAALAMAPDDPDLQTRIALLVRRLDDPEKAVEHLRDALRLAPDADGLRNQLAWTLATSGDPQIRRPDEAVQLAEPLVRESAKPDPNWLDTLAAAYAAAGRFEDAVRVAAQAAALAQEQGQLELGEQIRARLARYRAGQAYLEGARSDGA